ncbi:hypothetical protein BJ166DRAFT_191379 [Pestalotiopsis sp. NC0098]|nr:hypothetical protein BJ166DRAFT_191379 [Pestalotiopsis sp. NC0098]
MLTLIFGASAWAWCAWNRTELIRNAASRASGPIYVQFGPAPSHPLRVFVLVPAASLHHVECRVCRWGNHRFPSRLPDPSHLRRATGTGQSSLPPRCLGYCSIPYVGAFESRQVAHTLEICAAPSICGYP